MFVARFGRWNAALTRARLQPRPSPRDRFAARRYSDEQLVAALQAAAGADAYPPSLASYRTWTRHHLDAPSASTLRLRFGSWSAALDAAFPELLDVLI